MNWAFISIPKTGTNSIHRALNTNKKDNHKAVKLIEADFTFAFIRHPLDRLVSWYHGHRESNPSLTQYHVSFREWLLTGTHHWTPNVCKGFGIENPLNQWEFIEVDGVIKVDYLGSFERLELDFIEVCQRIGIQKKLPHILKSKHLHWSTYYDKSLKNYAELIYEKDLELWELLTSRTNY